MTARDRALPSIDRARAKVAGLGFRRFTVTIRKRTWSGGAPGAGAATNTDVVLTPAPRVRWVSSREIASSGGTYQEGDLRVDKITPSFAGGGYVPADLDPVLGDADDMRVVLVGDDGTKLCIPVDRNFDRAFGYSMIVRPTRETP